MKIEIRLFTCPKCDHLNVAVDGNYKCERCDWQPSRPMRKKLEAQLADWKCWHANREEELKVANAEIESMYRELADKQAIIDEQKKELDEARRQERHEQTIDYYMDKPIIIHFNGEKFYHLENYNKFVVDTVWLVRQAGNK